MATMRISKEVEILKRVQLLLVDSIDFINFNQNVLKNNPRANLGECPGLKISLPVLIPSLSPPDPLIQPGSEGAHAIMLIARQLEGYLIVTDKIVKHAVFERPGYTTEELETIYRDHYIEDMTGIEEGALWPVKALMQKLWERITRVDGDIRRKKARVKAAARRAEVGVILVPVRAWRKHH